MADVEIGKMFLNFILHWELRSLAGVDLTHYFPKDAKGSPVWEAWQQLPVPVRSGHGGGGGGDPW